jgi:DNA-binding NarL/FixJ family response regulator
MRGLGSRQRLWPLGRFDCDDHAGRASSSSAAVLSRSHRARRPWSVEATRHIAVLMVTASSHDKDIEAGFAAGADDYIVKPVDARILCARVRGAARRSASVSTPESPGIM